MKVNPNLSYINLISMNNKHKELVLEKNGKLIVKKKNI